MSIYVPPDCNCGGKLHFKSKLYAPVRTGHGTPIRGTIILKCNRCGLEIEPDDPGETELAKKAGKKLAEMLKRGELQFKPLRQPVEVENA